MPNGPAHAMSVRGPIEPAGLGRTQMHEHVVCVFDPSFRGLVHVLDDEEMLAAELGHFVAAGGSTIVDLTLPGIGRDVAALRRISERSGVNLIASTGLFRAPFYPAWLDGLTSDRLAQRFVAELHDGIDGTDIRAGVIGEIGTGRHGISPLEERVFRAAALAQRETGAAIMTHTWYGALALAQLEVLRAEGADLTRVVIGHFGDRRDLDAQLRVLETGASIAYDHIGLEEVQRDDVRAAAVADLVRRGFASQLVLSCDVSYKSRLHWHGGTGYDVLLTAFVPLLRDTGVEEDAIETMLVGNPRRLLTLGS